MQTTEVSGVLGSGHILTEGKDVKPLNKTNSICTVCKNGIPAELFEVENRIVMRKTCEDHGTREVLISNDAKWYHETMEMPAILKAPKDPKKTVDAGCPFDCGACTSHEQAVYLPVIPITSACNLDCPICYTINNNEAPFHMSLEEVQKQLDVIKFNDPDMKIINFTGGEPTLHPQFLEIIQMCEDAGIHRITISTHGLTFINDKKMVERLRDMNARIVLSFNGFDDEVWKKMVGVNATKSKMKVLDILEEYDLDTTLIPVLAKGHNDKDMGRLIDLLWSRKNIRSLEIHTMTFTGQGGLGFDPYARLTTSDVLDLIQKTTGDKIKKSDFVPSPCAHPLCYQTCYMMEDGENNNYIPFARFMKKEDIRDLLTDNLYMEPGPKMEQIMQRTIMDIWSSDMPEEEKDNTLRVLKNTIKTVFANKEMSYAERQKLSERAGKTIYIHSHMDDETFDTDRIKQCCVGVPDSDGTNIPTCAYNILYRGTDVRFAESEHLMPNPSTYTGGKKWS